MTTAKTISERLEEIEAETAVVSHRRPFTRADQLEVLALFDEHDALMRLGDAVGFRSPFRGEPEFCVVR
jgi:hypothetical protein